jgi:hypothetical protein
MRKLGLAGKMRNDICVACQTCWGILLPTVTQAKRKITMGNKIVTEADRKRSPPAKASADYTPPRKSAGQKISLERGTSTRNKKNPGKRPHKGG